MRGHQGTAGRTRGGPESIFTDFVTILRPRSESLLGTKELLLFIWFGLVSRSLFVQMFKSKSGRSVLLKQGVRTKQNILRTTTVRAIRLRRTWKRFFHFEGLGISFSDFLALETGMNIGGFQAGTESITTGLRL